MGLAVGLPTGILEELGWTGFAIPRLRLRHGVLVTGLIVGMLWGAWHLPVNYWASGVTSGEVSLAIWAPLWLVATLVGQLTAFRVLIVWIYERTDGSLPVAMLMHASLTTFHNYSLPSAGRNRQLDQWFRLCRRDVAGRCGGRHCPRRAPLATATSYRLRERLTSSDLPPFLRVDDRRASRWDIRRSQLAGTRSAQRPFVLRTWAGRPWPNED